MQFLFSSVQGGLPGSDNLCGLQSDLMVCLKVRAQSWRLQVLLTVQHLFFSKSDNVWWSRTSGLMMYLKVRDQGWKLQVLVAV